MPNSVESGFSQMPTDLTENGQNYSYGGGVQVGVLAKVLATDMRLNMALPCRISVYTENAETKIGLIKPEQMLAALSDNEA